MVPVSEQYDVDDVGMDAAVEAVAAGRVVVLPTDTVYGIGADPFSEDAVQALLDAKHRGRDMPPPVLIAEPSMMRSLTAQVPAAAKELASAFWPGPLTLILEAQRSADLHLGETRGTVALRVPDHDATREFLRRCGPLAVSSANRSGEPPATDVTSAREQLGDTVAVYLDGGPTPGPVPSTIVDLSSEPDGLVVRVGVLSVEQLQEVVPSVRLHEPDEPDGDADTEQDETPEQNENGAAAAVPDEAPPEHDA